jgi:DNA-binding GntR family transcriptional regulator
MTTPRRGHTRKTPIASSFVDAVHQAIRGRILAGAVTPGSTVMTELAVATEFGVDRVTATAAVERLVQDGLLRRTANKSARVTVATADDVVDAYFARRLLEGSAIQRLAEKGGVPEETRHLVSVSEPEPSTTSGAKSLSPRTRFIVPWSMPWGISGSPGSSVRT